MTYTPADLAEYNLRQTIKHIRLHNITAATLARVLRELSEELEAENARD